jgi:serine/threonine-protein kinase
VCRNVSRPLGILHRDVATQNLLVGRDGVTRLADFGIAKHALSSVVTDGQYLQGRVLYMPPEYLARAPDIDRRFDVYGLGVTMFLALTGDVPWPDASEAQIVHLATTLGIPRLSDGGLAIAPAIEELVARACHKQPAQRFATAREMLEAIEDIGRHTGWVASHGEVAALVEDLAGRSLAARRAAVARARVRDPVTPEANAAMSLTMAGVAPRVPSGELGPTEARPPAVIAWIAMATALALGAGILFAGRQALLATRVAAESARAPVASASAPSAPLASAPSANAPASSAPSASASASSAATPPAPTSTPATGASAAPTLRAGTRTPPGRTSPLRAPATSELAPPSAIITANPYR